LRCGFVFNQYLGGGDTIRKTATCTVTALRPFCSLEYLLPRPEGRTLVGDLRVKMPKEGTNAPPTAVYIYQTNQGWLSAQAAKDEFLNERAKYLATSGQNRVTPLELAALAALLMAPVAWFVFRPKSKLAPRSKPKKTHR
jgi:hypothetical protein